MGKFFVLGAALNQQLYVLAAFGILNSVISVYYYFGVARRAFFGQGEDESPIKAGGLMNAVVTITMVMTLLLALYGQPFIRFASESAQILAAVTF